MLGEVRCDTQPLVYLHLSADGWTGIAGITVIISITANTSKVLTCAFTALPPL